MPIGDYTNQLSFLKDSADSLHSQSPSTAAYLLSVHNQILHDHLKPLNQKQQETSCGGCGSVRTADSTESIPIQRKRTSGSSKAAEGATIYKCLRCHRRAIRPSRKETSRPVAPPIAAKLSSPASNQTASTSGPTEQTHPALDPKSTRTADNASSRKRAKARKQGGLQALLASKQQDKPSLDLFDFLQQ